MDDMEMDQELLAEFLTESNENLGDIEQRLLSLETSPDDAETINGIFRAIHTVKGTCGFLGLTRLEGLSHATESLLGKIRSEKFSVDTDLISLLLEAIDAIKTIIAAIESDGAEPNTDYSTLTNRLKAATRAIEDMTRNDASEQEMEAPASEETEAEVPPTQSEKPAEPEEQVQSEPPSAESAVEAEQAPTEKPQAKETAVPKSAAKPPAAETSIRVDTHIVDELMNQIGELVLTRNRLLQMVATGTAPEIQRITRNIDHTTTSLQDQVLRLRMQPVAGLWSRAPRVVRDLAHELGKRIQVVMEGEETELDRFILAALRDPMTHIIRNSCDHGVETPQERRASGKPEEGTIHLSARQESGNIVIEVRDDGKGIDADRVREKAVDMGLIARETADRMSTAASLQLIFHPGLSTAKTVSKVSGRGVGMDVVRAEIEKTGGSVEVESRIGQGTTLRMRIPLTLAIIPGLVVRTSGQEFAIPQMNVQELLGVSASDSSWESYAGSHFYRLRDKLLPVILLSTLLDLPPTEQKEEFTVVVIAVGSMQFGLAVDEVVGAEEIVVKPLGAHFQKLENYAGCSILGDGSVVPIIDCNGLMKMANMAQASELALSKETNVSQERPRRNLQHIVLFEYGDERYAIPMSIVQRLETVTRNKLEKVGGNEVLQYRGEVIPFRRWHNLLQLGPESGEPNEELNCVILSDGNGHLCLEVGQILDVAEVPLDVELGSNHSIFLGTAVIFDQATEIVDVYELVKAVAPEWFGKAESDVDGGKLPLLLLEGSPFFRDMLLPTLESLGYAVWTADSTLQAKAWLELHTPSMIISDLDMPDQQGVDLARWVKNQERLAAIPIVALASFQPQRNEDSELFATSLTKTEPASLRSKLHDVLGLSVAA